MKNILTEDGYDLTTMDYTLDRPCGNCNRPNATVKPENCFVCHGTGVLKGSLPAPRASLTPDEVRSLLLCEASYLSCPD